MGDVRSRSNSGQVHWVEILDWRLFQRPVRCERFECLAGLYQNRWCARGGSGANCLDTA